MKISITEEQYSKLIQANEVVGVPEGIYDTAKEIYSKYIVNLIQEIGHQFGNMKLAGSTDIDFTIEGDYNVGDMSFSTIDFTVTFDFDKHDKFEISQMSFGIGDRMTNDYKVKYNTISDSIVLGAKYGVPYDMSEEDLVNNLMNVKNKTISSIAHELKHAYDFQKKPIRNAGEKVQYHSIEDLMVSVGPLMKLKTMLYYSHVVEETVRNSEIYTLMKLKGITKKQFRSFLSKTTTYEFLIYMKNYDYNTFIKEMYKSIRGIDAFLTYVNVDHTNMSDSEKVTTTLEKFYQIVLRRRKDFIDSVMFDMKSEFIQLFAASLGIADNIRTMGENVAKKNAIKKINKHIASYIDYTDFYQKELEGINIAAVNALKRLGKLYSLAED